MFESTKKFFCMLPLHMCSGRPVDGRSAAGRIRRAFVARRPSASVALRYRSPAFFTRSINSSDDELRSTSRARCAKRMSRCNRPPLAWLTLAIGSPVAKWTTWSTSSDSYGFPQRRIGRFNTSQISEGRAWLVPWHAGRMQRGRLGGLGVPAHESLQSVTKGQYTPTVVASANSWNGRTPLTPSQGYFS